MQKSHAQDESDFMKDPLSENQHPTLGARGNETTTAFMLGSLALGAAMMISLCASVTMIPARAAYAQATEACSVEAGRAGWQSPDVRGPGDTDIDFAALIDSLATSRVVFVGESHDRFDHHLNQLEIICRLHERHPDLAIAMEFFQQPSQRDLDAFVEGRTDMATMLRATEYYERWRYDYRLYRAIMNFARENGIPLVALNLPTEITRKVGRGGIASLDEEERAAIPSELDRSDEDYRARIEEAFEQHPEREHGDFESFFEVQLLWDEGMAEQIARYLDAHGERRVVVLAGVGHVLRSGVPQRLARRNPAAATVVLQGDAATAFVEGGDFLLASGQMDLPQAGMLGVMLETGDDGVIVRGFGEDSAAEKAGIREGDSIVGLDGHSVHRYVDVKLALLHKRPGDTVSVQVGRDGETDSQVTVAFDVTLR